jgi:hypothetical protein
MLARQAGAQADEPIVLRSQAGRFRLRLTGIPHPERLNRLHGLDLALATADGRPAAGAMITVTGRRLYAPNPLPTAPQVRPGPMAGSYQIEGLRFHMAGEWRLMLDIQFERIRDRAVLDLLVE